MVMYHSWVKIIDSACIFSSIFTHADGYSRHSNFSKMQTSPKNNLELKYKKQADFCMYLKIISRTEKGCVNLDF